MLLPVLVLSSSQLRLRRSSWRLPLSLFSLWRARRREGSRLMTLVLSLVLQTPTSLSARSNMLLRREMMMNCASLVRFLMQSATMATFLKSRAASISSMKQRGVGLQQWRAKMREREERVFSPPDSLFTSFQLFLGGRTLKLTPSLKGSSASISSSSASPPRVRCWQTSFSLQFITPNPSRNTRSRSSLSWSMMRLSSPCRSRTASNSRSRSRYCAYLLRNSLMISRLLPSRRLSSAASAVMRPNSFSLKQEKCSSWSSVSCSRGLVRTRRSAWKMRGLLASREELSMEVSRREEELRSAARSCPTPIFSISSSSSRKEQVAVSSRQSLRTFSSSCSLARASSAFLRWASRAASTSLLAFSTLALLSRTSFSSSSIIFRSSLSAFLLSRRRSSQAVILAISSETLRSSSTCWALKASMSRLEASVRRSLSVLVRLSSSMRLREFSRMALSWSNCFSSAAVSAFSALYRSRSCTTSRASPCRCSSSRPRSTPSASARASSARPTCLSSSNASLSRLLAAVPRSALESMSRRSLLSSSNSLMLSTTATSSRRICSMSIAADFSSPSSLASRRPTSSSCSPSSFFRASRSRGWLSAFGRALVAALGVKPPRRGAQPAISPFISMTTYPLRFLFLEMTLRRWWSLRMAYSMPRSESSQQRVSERAKQKASLASSVLNLMRSKSRTARGRFSKGRFMQWRWSAILSRMMQVARPRRRVLRKLRTASPVAKSATTMLSRREQQVVMTSSCSRETSPRSPSRPSTPGKPCCITSRNMFPSCPCCSCCDSCSRTSPSTCRSSTRSCSRCRPSSPTRSVFSLAIFSAIARAFSIFSRTSALAAALAWQSRSLPSSSPRPERALPAASRAPSSLLRRLPASSAARWAWTSHSRMRWRRWGFSCSASCARRGSRAVVLAASASLAAGSRARMSSQWAMMRASSRSLSWALRSNLTRSSLLQAISWVRCLSSSCSLLQPSCSFSRPFPASSCSALLRLISLMRSACVFRRSRSSATMRSRVRSSSAACSRCLLASACAAAAWTWAQTFCAWKSVFSLRTKRTASSLALVMPLSSFSTRRMSCPFSCFCSSAARYSRPHSSMRSMNTPDPMISSRYSSSPGLSRSPDFCRICEICSTSPCRMRKRLLARSMPSPRRRSLTSAWEVSRPSRKYLDWELLLTVRRMAKWECGRSASCPSGSSWTFLKWTSTAARALPVEELELWMSWLSLFSRIQLALKPKMNSMLSIRFDFPDPFGPTTLVKLPWNFPTTCRPAYDLKSSSTMWSITSRGRRYRTFRLTTARASTALASFPLSSLLRSSRSFSGRAEWSSCSGARRSRPSMASLSDSSCMNNVYESRQRPPNQAMKSYPTIPMPLLYRQIAIPDSQSIDPSSSLPVSSCCVVRVVRAVGCCGAVWGCPLFCVHVFGWCAFVCTCVVICWLLKNYQDMVVITVDGKEYELTEKHEAVMQYIKEAKAIEQGGIKVTNIDQQTFEFILHILVTLNYELKEPPKINTNVLEDVIGKDLAALISKLNPKELNSLYRAVHFLKIYPLRRAIAAVVATRVHIQPTLDDYNAKKAELDLKKELNTDISKEYKERFPFMN